jgi:hypothetical protein
MPTILDRFTQFTQIIWLAINQSELHFKEIDISF